MNGRGWRAWILALASSGIVLAAAAQPPAPPGETSVGVEVARLNASLQELVALMKKQLDGQRIELLMRQVELKRSKLAPFEAELRSTRAARDGAEQELQNLKVNQEQMEQSLEAELGSTDGTPEQAEQMEKMVEQSLRHFVLQTKMTRDRLASLEQKLQILDSDAATARAEVEHWEALVERELQR